MATKSKKGAPITKRTVFKDIHGHTMIAEPYTPPPAPTPKPKKLPPLSASQARRAVRDLDYFLQSGEITQVKYKTARAEIVARLS